jgi:hypothetical protein
MKTLKKWYAENEKGELRYFFFRFFAQRAARKTVKKTNEIRLFGKI